MVKYRKAAANMGLASCGVTCLNSSAVFQINFSARLTVLCPETPHERQARKPLPAIIERHPTDRRALNILPK